MEGDSVAHTDSLPISKGTSLSNAIDFSSCRVLFFPSDAVEPAILLWILIMDTSLLTQGATELNKLKEVIEDAEKAVIAGAAEVSLAAIGSQSKVLTLLFKQLAASEIAKSPQYRVEFQQFSSGLKDLLVRVNTLRLHKASPIAEPALAPAAPAPAVNILLAPSTVPISSSAPVVLGPVAPAPAPAPPAQAPSPAPTPTISIVAVDSPALAPLTTTPTAAASTVVVSALSSSPSATEAPEPDPKKATRKFVLKGWLRKQGDIGLKTWKRRFFRFKDGKLLYFADEEDLKPKGWIDLSTMISCAVDEGDKFSITCTNRVWHLQAEKEKDAQNWIKALQIWAQKTHVLSGAGKDSADRDASDPHASGNLFLGDSQLVQSSSSSTSLMSSAKQEAERKRAREEENERLQKERETREMERQKKAIDAQKAQREAALAEALAAERAARGDTSQSSSAIVRVTVADVETLRSALTKIRENQAHVRGNMHELSSRLDEIRRRTQPSEGLPVLMQLQAQLATRKDTMRQVWTPAVQQYHSELTNKQSQLLDIKSKASTPSREDSGSDPLAELDAAWASLENRSRSTDAQLSDLAFERMFGHPPGDSGLSAKDRVRYLAEKRDVWQEALSAISLQLSVLEEKDDSIHVAEAARVAKVADTILTRRAQLLLARSQFQHLRMRCNMSWTGSSLLTFEEELAQLSTDYAQLLITNVKLHLLQQTGTLPRINAEELLSQLMQPEMKERWTIWPKHVANFIYTAVDK